MFFQLGVDIPVKLDITGKFQSPSQGVKWHRIYRVDIGNYNYVK